MRGKKNEEKEKQMETKHVTFTITLRCESRTARVSRTIADWFNSRHVISLILHVVLFESYNAGVPKVCSADPKASTISSQWIRGYISVMTTLKSDVLLKIIAKLL